MKRAFKDAAVSKAARMTKKHKLFAPVIFLGLGLILGFYNVIKHICYNAKRYTTLGVVLLFFFMSSSFATPDQVLESEVYLLNNESSKTSVETSSEYQGDGAGISSDGFVNLDASDDFEIVSGELISREEEIELESTDNIDTFTLTDFYSEICLSDSNVSQESDSGFDKDAWYLLLVNKTHPVPDGYEVPLTTIKGSMKCDERVLEPLINMLDGALSDGVNLVVCSPFRDYQLQEKLFLRKVNAYMSYGMSYLEAYKKASTDVIVPGASEHQLGIAFDIVVDYHAVLDADFGNTPGGIWLKEHCAEYGFILRYPKGKENITGIEYEPWHFRYVGEDAASYIMENDVTLEEFLDNL